MSGWCVPIGLAKQAGMLQAVDAQWSKSDTSLTHKLCHAESRFPSCSMYKLYNMILPQAPVGLLPFLHRLPNPSLPQDSSPRSKLPFLKRPQAPLTGTTCPTAHSILSFGLSHSLASRTSPFVLSHILRFH